jgi:glucose uptake protein GlcU
VSRSAETGRSTGRVMFAVILGIIAIAFIVVGIVYCVEPSGSLPAWLGRETVQVGRQQLPSTTYRPLRAVGSLIAGVVFGIGSWFSLFYKAKAVPPAGAEVTGVS